jgi:hypothetical protein
MQYRGRQREMSVVSFCYAEGNGKCKFEGNGVCTGIVFCYGASIISKK